VKVLGSPQRGGAVPFALTAMHGPLKVGKEKTIDLE